MYKKNLNFFFSIFLQVFNYICLKDCEVFLWSDVSGKLSKTELTGTNDREFKNYKDDRIKRTS